jgi:hypothetical protein
MSNNKKFYLKLALLIAAVTAVQLCFYFGVGAGRYRTQRFILNKIDRHLAAGKQVLYFGDSTVMSICPDDADKRTLFWAVQDKLGMIAAGDVAHPAFSLTQYELLCKYVFRQPVKPACVVVPVNIRSFSTLWDLRPEWQFPKEEIFVEHDRFLFRVFYEPLTKFSAPFFSLAPISKEDYLEAPVYNGTEIVGRIADYYINFDHPPENPDLMKQYTWCYMHSIVPEHRKVKSLLKIIDAARKTGVKTVFYITPVDYQTGTELIGPEFETRLSQNVDMLQSTAKNAGAGILDFSRLLPSSMFCPPPYMPNEHMTDVGRAILAEKLAEAVLDAVKTAAP